MTIRDPMQLTERTKMFSQEIQKFKEASGKVNIGEILSDLRDALNLSVDMKSPRGQPMLYRVVKRLPVVFGEFGSVNAVESLKLKEESEKNPQMLLGRPAESYIGEMVGEEDGRYDFLPFVLELFIEEIASAERNNDPPHPCLCVRYSRRFHAEISLFRRTYIEVPLPQLENKLKEFINLGNFL